MYDGPELSADLQRVFHEVQAFSEAEIAPRVADMEATRAVEVDLLKAIAQRGFIGAAIGKEYGGMGVGHLGKTVMIEGISRVSPAMGAAAQASQLGAGVMEHCSKKQKDEWFPQITAGTCLPTIAVTEAGSGSYVAGTQTTARRHRGGYTLTGRKVYVGNSHTGHVHGVFARTGDTLSAFLVESNRHGFSLAPHTPALGLHGFSFGELILDNCWVPAANLIGEEGDGLRIAYSSSVRYGRPNLTAVALGIQQGVLDLTVRFAEERKRNGSPIANLGTVEAKLGRMEARLINSRVITHSAAQALDQIDPAAGEDRSAATRRDAALMASKYEVVKSTLDSVREAMEIHGAHALRTDYPLERFMRDAWHIYPPAGTGDIQIKRLAEVSRGTYQPVTHPSTQRA